ncbi:MAG: AraC family transcriptional regulator [Crocinitomicaceae bacterium]|nr:AraC family transcriptional regulator [Crocinitomicaceae bacterium]|tara:strand:- start:376 stop:1248 length:873 start_codon:yes stop_codon:yes gene_type:complete
MSNYFEYLTSGAADKEWGLYLTTVGKYHALPHEPYPSKSHPNGYYFEWKQGRFLNEFQLNYITEGHGIMQTRAGEFPIKPGSLIIMRPGILHRYKPNSKTGWTENYIGFNGNLAPHFVQQVFEDPDIPVIKIGHHVEVLDSFQKIIDLVKEQKPAYHQVASGLIIKALGYISTYIKTQNIGNEDVDKLIHLAKAYMWENVTREIDLHTFSKDQRVSYSYFRKTFKMYTGIAPHQFFLELKMMRAKELIVSSDMSIKEITYQLGFDSIYYFSRLFKKKMGLSPTDLRKMNL